MLSKSEILSARKPTMEAVEVPEWGGTVNVKVMSGSELDKYFEESMVFDDGKYITSQVNRTARLLVKCVCDSDGNRMFSDSDAEAVGCIDNTILLPLYEVALRVNKMSGDVVKNS